MQIEWDKYRVQLHEVGRSRWPRGVKTNFNWKPDFVCPDNDLLCFTGGTGRLRLPSGWVKLRPGLCFWLRSDVKYYSEQSPTDPVTSSFFHFDLVDARGRKRPACAPLPPEVIEPPDAEMIEAVTRRIVDMSFGFGAHGFVPRIAAGPTATVAHTLFTGVLMELDAASTDGAHPPASGLTVAQQRAVQVAMAHILRVPHETYQRQQLARLAGYNADHFARLFRRHTGLNPEQFAIRARVHHAQRLLRETAQTVSEIATLAGYRNIYFFSRQFKQVTGQSPQAYRRQPTEAQPARK